MRKALFLTAIILALGLLVYGYLFIKNKMESDIANNKRIANAEQQLQNITQEINDYQLRKELAEQSKTIASSGAADDLLEETPYQIIPSSFEETQITPLPPKESPATHPAPPPQLSSNQKIWYIKNVYLGEQATITVDLIETLPLEECLPALVCFKNEIRQTTKFAVDPNVNIQIHTFEYLFNWKWTISLDTFWRVFHPDLDQEGKEYNQFKEIPYWLTFKNNKIVNIEEQPLSTLQ